MVFHCTIPHVPAGAAASVALEALVPKARELGLGPAYAVAGVEMHRHRWRHGLVDVVVHVSYGGDVLYPQFPDEATLAIAAAIGALLQCG